MPKLFSSLFAEINNRRWQQKPESILACIALVAITFSSGAAFAQSTQYKEAFSAYQTQNFTAAENIWTDLANVGDADAQYAMGVMHLRQEASDSSLAAAFSWFDKAAKQGHATAMFNLGVAYWQGSGVPRDKKRALFLWQNAADKGDSGAQFNLGLVYYTGEERAPDLTRAKKWMSLAATQNYPEAKRILGVIESRLGESGGNVTSGTTFAATTNTAINTSTASSTSNATGSIANSSTPESSESSSGSETSAAVATTSNPNSGTQTTSSTEAVRQYWQTGSQSVSVFHKPNGISFLDLPAGTPLEVTGQDRGWAKITLPDGIRTWIFSKFIEVEGDKGIITGNSIHVRPRPSANNAESPSLGVYPRGAVVIILDQQQYWVQIRAPKTIGGWLQVENIIQYKDTQSGRNRQWQRALANGL